MDILDYAIKMEEDGERFYLDLAEKNKNNKLHIVFESIANDEAHHASIIKDKKEGIESSLTGKVESNVNNIFSDPKSFKLESQIPQQVDAYNVALQKEQESIDLYERLLSETEKDKELFTFLLDQEKEHYRLIEEIIKMVNRPNVWVESAEFGLRKEY